jgi:hypothetical protein
MIAGASLWWSGDRGQQQRLEHGDARVRRSRRPGLHCHLFARWQRARRPGPGVVEGLGPGHRDLRRHPVDAALPQQRRRPGHPSSTISALTATSRRVARCSLMPPASAISVITHSSTRPPGRAHDHRGAALTPAAPARRLPAQVVGERQDQICGVARTEVLRRTRSSCPMRR